MFTFSIIVASAINPTTAYIVPGGLSTTIGVASVNAANLSFSGSYIFAAASGTYGLTLNYTGGTGVTIANNSYYQAIRIA